MKIWGISPTVRCSAVFLLLALKYSRMWFWARLSLACTKSGFVTGLCCKHSVCKWTAQLFPLSAFKLGAMTLCLAQRSSCAFINPSDDTLWLLNHCTYSDGSSTGLLVKAAHGLQNPPEVMIWLRLVVSQLGVLTLGCWSGWLWFSFSFLVFSQSCFFLFHTVFCNILKFSDI